MVVARVLHCVKGTLDPGEYAFNNNVAVIRNEVSNSIETVAAAPGKMVGQVRLMFGKDIDTELPSALDARPSRRVFGREESHEGGI